MVYHSDKKQPVPRAILRSNMCLSEQYVSELRHWRHREEHKRSAYWHTDQTDIYDSRESCHAVMCIAIVHVCNSYIIISVHHVKKGLCLCAHTHMTMQHVHTAQAPLQTWLWHTSPPTSIRRHYSGHSARKLNNTHNNLHTCTAQNQTQLQHKNKHNFSTKTNTTSAQKQTQFRHTC